MTPGARRALLRPKYVALDTSQLVRLIDDTASDDSGRQSNAAGFSCAFADRGGVLLLSWHHFQELLTHRDPTVIARRMKYIQSLEMVATPRSIGDESLPGSIIDIEGLEVRAAFQNPNANLNSVRDAVAVEFYRILSGETIIRQFIQAWPILKDAFREQSARTREIVAIANSDFARIGHAKLADFLGRGARSPAERSRVIDQLHARLSADIGQRGDKRIPDAAATSAAFFHSLEPIGEKLPPDRDPALALLASMGINPTDISPDTTLAEIGDLAGFQAKLSVVNRSLGLPWNTLKKRVTADRLPSTIIQRAIRRFRPEAGEWKGSDLTDMHLACLAPYADITYVDKRTHEALRTAQRNAPSLKSLLRRVEKARNYIDIVTQLS
jgi:hypothetical protein